MDSNFSRLFPGVHLTSLSGESLCYELPSGKKLNLDLLSVVKFLTDRQILRVSDSYSKDDILAGMKKYEESQNKSEGTLLKVKSIGARILTDKHFDPLAELESLERDSANREIDRSLSPDSNASFVQRGESSFIKERKSPLYPSSREKSPGEVEQLSPIQLEISDQKEAEEISTKQTRLVEYFDKFSDPSKGLIRLKRIIPLLTYADFRMTKEEMGQERFKQLSQLAGLCGKANQILTGIYRPPT